MAKDELAYVWSLLAQKCSVGRSVSSILSSARSVSVCRPTRRASRMRALPIATWPAESAHGQRQGDANALCAFHHVGVRHDVAVGVYDHSRATACWRTMNAVWDRFFLAERPVCGDEDLPPPLEKPLAARLSKAPLSWTRTLGASEGLASMAAGTGLFSGCAGF